MCTCAQPTVRAPPEMDSRRPLYAPHRGVALETQCRWWSSDVWSLHGERRSAAVHSHFASAWGPVTIDRFRRRASPNDGRPGRLRVPTIGHDESILSSKFRPDPSHTTLVPSVDKKKIKNSFSSSDRMIVSTTLQGAAPRDFCATRTEKYFFQFEMLEKSFYEM